MSFLFLHRAHGWDGCCAGYRGENPANPWPQWGRHEAYTSDYEASVAPPPQGSYEVSPLSVLTFAFLSCLFSSDPLPWPEMASTARLLGRSARYLDCTTANRTLFPQ